MSGRVVEHYYDKYKYMMHLALSEGSLHLNCERPSRS